MHLQPDILLSRSSTALALLFLIIALLTLSMPHLLNHHPPAFASSSIAFSLVIAPSILSPVKFVLPHGHGISSARTKWSHGRGCSVKCMANPRRVQMVAKQIRRELSDMLLTDKVLQFAVLPEAKLGADRYLSSLTTISDVEVSGDLQVVKVYVSVFGDERGKEVAIAGLKSKAKYVRSELGKRMKLRLTPEIRFIEDEALERGSRVIAILDKIKEEDQGKISSTREDDSSYENADEKDWEEDDPDEEGIIYVK